MLKVDKDLGHEVWTRMMGRVFEDVKLRRPQRDVVGQDALSPRPPARQPAPARAAGTPGRHTSWEGQSRRVLTTAFAIQQGNKELYAEPGILSREA